MTSLGCAIVFHSPVSSVLDENTLFSTVNEIKRRSSCIRMDDAIIDYTNMIGLEDKKRRFSEDVVDMDIKERERLQKLYRQSLCVLD